MRNIFLTTLAVLCAGMFTLAYANVTSDKNTASSKEAVECPMNDLVKFEFTDANKTTFKIPRPYLYKPYPMFNLEEERNYIVLYVQKKTLKPNCKEIHHLDSDHYMIIIEGLKPSGFSGILKRMQDDYTAFVTQEGNFKLYRKTEDLKKANLVSVDDFLIPSIENKLLSFIKCTRPNLKGDIAPRAACSVNSEISNTTYIQYVIKSEELGQWHSINNDIINLIHNFQIQSQGETK
jgi:hypothetical protein